MISSQDLINQLNWRYATKRFDSSKKLSPEQWNTLERVLILTPSSYGMQPWQFWLVSNQETLKKLKAASFNQPQVEECSHFLVFAGKKTITEIDVENYMDYVVQVRKIPVEGARSYAQVITNDLVKGPRSAVIREWAARQTYIALGNLMTSAALMGIDACPMEGIVATQYDEILNLKDTDFATTVACAIGFRSNDDAFSRMPKVRYPSSQLLMKVE